MRLPKMVLDEFRIGATRGESTEHDRACRLIARGQVALRHLQAELAHRGDR